MSRKLEKKLLSNHTYVGLLLQIYANAGVNKTSDNQPNETNHQLSSVLPSNSTENPYTFLVHEHQLRKPGIYFGIKLVGEYIWALQPISLVVSNFLKSKFRYL